MSKYTLLTGSTGLLGRYLLRDLLLAGQRVVVVARPTQQESVSQRLESILQHWEAQRDDLLPRPVCIEGDISQELLGLDEKACHWIAQNCSSVVHSAAALTFQEEADGEPWRTNVQGTRNVLELCHDTSIRELHYVSTAYVCGARSDRIMERELDIGQSFRNDYERSKLKAETLVRHDDHLSQVTVYRPAVIAGDSQTGYTSSYHGLFMYLKLISVLSRNIEPDADGIRRTALKLYITGDEPRNVIPVDWAAAVITHLFLTPNSHGRTFHLAPRLRMTARQMIEAGYTYFNSTGVEFVGPLENPSASGIGLQAYENSMLYRAYEGSDPEFDTTNLQRFAGHLPCPEIDESMLHRFFRYGESDRWGKRKSQVAKMPLFVEEYLQRLMRESPESGKLTTINREMCVGLDVLGPGGGQWTIALTKSQILSYEPGIQPDCTAVLRIDSVNFFRLGLQDRAGLRAKLTEYLQHATCTDLRELASLIAQALFPTV